MTSLVTPCSHSDNVEVWKKATEDSIAVHGVKDIEIFTDGSVVNKCGAGAANIYVKNIRGRDIIHKAIAPAGPLCSSFKAEIVGIQCGLDKLISTEAIIKENKSIIICTDSQALLKKLQMGPITQTIKPCSDIWCSTLYLMDRYHIPNITFQWVKGHVGVDRNEEADKACDKALEVYTREIRGSSQKKSSILLQGIKAEVKSHLVQKYKSKLDMTKHRYLVCGDKFSDLQLSATYSRTDEVLCNQLRVDRCTLMGAYGFMVNKRQSPLCRWCKNVDETVVHVFSDCQSPSIIQLRLELNVQDVTVLHKSPLLGLKFCRDAINII